MLSDYDYKGDPARAADYVRDIERWTSHARTWLKGWGENPPSLQGALLALQQAEAALSAAKSYICTGLESGPMPELEVLQKAEAFAREKSQAARLIAAELLEILKYLRNYARLLDLSPETVVRMDAIIAKAEQEGE